MYVSRAEEERESLQNLCRLQQDPRTLPWLGEALPEGGLHPMSMGELDRISELFQPAGEGTALAPRCRPHELLQRQEVSGWPAVKHQV